MPDAVWVYVGVFGALMAAGFGAPIPEELPIATAGGFVGHASQQGGHPVWWIMLPVCIIGVVLSDGVLYGIGRYWGPALLDRQWAQKLLTAEKRQRIEKNFADYGIMILLAARITPGIRTPIFITAGMIRLPLRRFLLADGLYAIPGVNLIFWLAFWFTDQFVEALKQIESHRPLVVVAVLSAVAGYLLYSFLRRPVVTGDPSELPPIAQRVARIVEGHRHSDGSKEVSPPKKPASHQPPVPPSAPTEHPSNGSLDSSPSPQTK